MKTAFALACVASSASLATAFFPTLIVPNQRTSTTKMMAWTPDRAPQTNPQRSGLLADASFDRAVVRENVDYMDNDQQNPPAETKWWEAYYPSKEEQEAAAAGFDFKNPETWLEAVKAGTFKLDTNQPTEFQAVETFTAAGREWPELKKVVKS